MGKPAEPGETLVAIHERPVHQEQATFLVHGQPIQFQASGGDFERPDGHVEADDFLELFVAQELSKQVPFAAPQVEDPPRSRGPQRGQHGPQPRFVQADGLLKAGLGGLWFVLQLQRRRVFLGQPREGLAGQAGLMLEVPVGDGFALGMRGQPPFALGEEFFHLVAADVIMLAVVEHRNEHVKVRQQLGQGRRLLERDRVVWALAPLGELLVQRMPHSVDHVPQRPEDALEELRPTTAREDGDRGPEGDRGRGQFGPLLAASLEGGAEHLGDSHAHKRRGDVRAVVDVLVEEPLVRRPFAADHADGIHVQQERRRAPLGRRLRVEDVHLAETDLELLALGRVLVQQVPEVRRGSVSCCDGKKHVRSAFVFRD